jgi:hypothetical protein
MVTETYNATPEVILTLTSQGIEGLQSDVVTIILDEQPYEYTFEEFFNRLGIE